MQHDNNKTDISMNIYEDFYDEVIASRVAIAKCTYKYALDNLVPLINRYEDQRKIQNKKFYERLKKDIVRGCIMPPITVAFVNDKSKNIKNLETYITENIDKGYVLDGIQRLNTLHAAKEIEGFDENRVVFLNIIISNSQDKLLYRMITLNNGQRPMTARHQVEILTKEMFDFDDYENVVIRTEKEIDKKRIKHALKLSDVSKAYLAFLTENVNTENNKIIEGKMDEILVGRLFDVDISKQNHNFYDVLEIVDALCENDDVLKWFKIDNNLVGFCVGIKNTFSYIEKVNSTEFSDIINVFESAFDGFETSKLNVGRYRRELVSDYISSIEKFIDYDEAQLLDYFAEKTA